MELLNGHIYIHVDLGTGAVKLRASRRRVDEGNWHELILRRTGRECKVAIDGQWNEFRTPGDATQFELDSPIYVGGTGTSFGTMNWSPTVWTAALKQGFIGCLRDLALNGKPVDIAAFARQQDSGLHFSRQLLSTFYETACVLCRRCEAVVPRAGEPVRRPGVAVPERGRLQRGMEPADMRLLDDGVHRPNLWARVDHARLQRQPAHDGVGGRQAGNQDADRGARAALQNQQAVGAAARDERRLYFARSIRDLPSCGTRACQRQARRPRKGA